MVNKFPYKPFGYGQSSGYGQPSGFGQSSSLPSGYGYGHPSGYGQHPSGTHSGGYGQSSGSHDSRFVQPSQPQSQQEDSLQQQSTGMSIAQPRAYEDYEEFHIWKLLNEFIEGIEKSFLKDVDMWDIVDEELRDEWLHHRGPAYAATARAAIMRYDSRMSAINGQQQISPPIVCHHGTNRITSFGPSSRPQATILSIPKRAQSPVQSAAFADPKYTIAPTGEPGAMLASKWANPAPKTEQAHQSKPHNPQATLPKQPQQASAPSRSTKELEELATRGELTEEEFDEYLRRTVNRSETEKSNSLPKPAARLSWSGNPILPTHTIADLQAHFGKVLYPIIKETGEYNDMRINPKKMGLNRNEDLNACYGTYWEKGPACPYAKIKNGCIRNHNVTQSQLDELVTSGRITPMRARLIVASHEKKAPADSKNILRVNPSWANVPKFAPWQQHQPPVARSQRPPPNNLPDDLGAWDPPKFSATLKADAAKHRAIVEERVANQSKQTPVYKTTCKDVQTGKVTTTVTPSVPTVSPPRIPKRKKGKEKAVDPVPEDKPMPGSPPTSSQGGIKLDPQKRIKFGGKSMAGFK